MGRTAWLTLLMAGLAASAAAQATDALPTTRTLVIAAQDASGMPLVGVAFEADVAGAAKATGATGKTGIARLGIPGTADASKVAVRLADTRYQMPQPAQRVTPNAAAPTQFFIAHLLPADVAAMSPLERSSLVDALPSLYRKRWQKGEKAEGGPLRYAAFLEGFGEEEAPSPEQLRKAIATPAPEVTFTPDDPVPIPTPMPPMPTLVVTVKDRAGAPQANRSVLLFELSDSPGRTRMTMSRRSDDNGRAVFRGLKAGVAYRPLVPEDRSELYAPGPILVLPEAAPKQPPRELTLVLREKSRSVAGLVFMGDQPARSVKLRTQDPTQPTVETMSDEFGYFELGPLRPGETRLVIEEPRTRRTAEITAALGAGELLVPLDVLMAPAGK